MPIRAIPPDAYDQNNNKSIKEILKVKAQSRVVYSIRYTKRSYIVYNDIYIYIYTMINGNIRYIYDIFSSIRYTSIYDCEITRKQRRLMS